MDQMRYLWLGLACCGIIWGADWLTDGGNQQRSTGKNRLADMDTLVIKQGRLVEGGDAEAMVRRPQNPYTKKLLDAVPQLGPWENAPKEVLL